MSAHLPNSILATPTQFSRDSEAVRSLSIRTCGYFIAAPIRLSYLLTLPEYVETWLAAPDVDEVRCTGNPTIGEPLCIQLHYNRRIKARIFADYISIQPCDLQIRWHVRSRTHASFSNICIALRTVRSNTVLRICHIGFSDPRDLQWHQELWDMSLPKMKLLVR